MALKQGHGSQIEVLMVRRNPELSFGGMWTFPGGVVEEADGAMPDVSDGFDEDTMRWEDPSVVATAANAAVREAREETALNCAVSSLTWFSHWLPPKVGPPKRFGTWFFLAPEHAGTVVVDDTENDEARWVSAATALEESAAGRFPLATPTWVTLDDLAQATDIASLIDHALTQGPSWYHTRKLVSADPSAPPVMGWPGDAGYESENADEPGARNRVVTNKKFEIVERVRSV